MKSPSNKTKYDDKLFFQIISDSLKKLFICPCEKPFTIKKTKNTNIQIEKTGTHPVLSSAAGKIIHTSEDTLILEHENNLYTKYTNIRPTLSTKEKIKQGIKIAEFTNTFSFSILIKPTDLTGDTNV